LPTSQSESCSRPYSRPGSESERLRFRRRLRAPRHKGGIAMKKERILSIR
jgi:hypothetical protein